MNESPRVSIVDPGPSDYKIQEETTDNKPSFSSSNSHQVLFDLVEEQPHVQPQRHGVCCLIVDHYRIAFGVTFAIEMLVVVLSVKLCLDDDYKLFPVDFKGVPMDLKSDDTYRRYMAHEKRWKGKHMTWPEADRLYLPFRFHVSDCLDIIYESDNVLTKEKLQAIADVEKWLIDFEVWDKWGQTDENDITKKPTSLIRYFDGTYGSDLNDTGFNNIPETLFKAYSRRALKKEVETLIANDAVISKNEVKSSVTRSIFKLGKNYWVTDEIITEFWKNYTRDKLYELIDKGRAGMKIYFYNEALFIEDIMEQVEKDLLLALCSFVFIFSFILFQTRSLFITVFGIGSILTSFLWTNYIYRVMLGYRYFGIFHAISIFIILGIGSDDLFVFYDMWRTTGCMDLNSVVKRFRFCYRHAALSMLITSVTTALAFYSNIFTELYGLYTFALFTSLLVIINYMSAIAFFPMCVLLYHQDVRPCTWPWRLCCKITAEEKKPKPNIVVRFFKYQFHRLVTHRILKWVFIVACTLFAVICIFFAYRLETSEKELQYYRSGFNYQDARILQYHAFQRTVQDKRIKVSLLFGVKPQDLSSCDEFDYRCEGHVAYDDALDLNPIPAQRSLMKICEMLKNLTGPKDLHINREDDLEPVCFLNQMDKFFQKDSQAKRKLKSSVNISLPISGIKFLPLVPLYSDIYNQSVILSGNFYRFFETAVQYWMTNAYQATYVDIDKYNEDLWISKLIGLALEGDDLNLIDPDFKSAYGHRLRFFEIQIPTDLVFGKIDFKTGIQANDAWEKFTKDLMLQLPPSVQGFQVADQNEWHLFKVAQTLQESAVRGIMLGVFLAFIVLAVATNNLIISFLATINILLVVATFAGCINIFGWKISVIESINLSLVAGLAVDYVVHFSESYHQAPHFDRQHKVRDMLEHMGISVLSGAITTAGAAVFMLFAQIYFFFQFGIFIIITILFSLIYSLFWFTPMLSVVGPEGDMGSITKIIFYILDYLKVFIRRWEVLDEEHKRMSYSRSSVSEYPDREYKQLAIQVEQEKYRRQSS